MSKRILSVLLCVICVSVCACSAKPSDTALVSVSESVSSSEVAVNSETSQTQTSSVKSADSSKQTSKVSDGSSGVTSSHTESSGESSSKTTDSSAPAESSRESGSETSKAAESAASSQIQTYTVPAGNVETYYGETETQTQSSDVSSAESAAEQASTEIEEEQPSEGNIETSSQRTLPDKTGREKKIIVLDAGHQKYPNFDTEPIAPGSWEMKIKVSGGTTGVVTGIPEYELTLALALRLQTILEERGYEVVQTRTSNDVDIGNIDRAEVANSINADAFIRIHANGSDYSSVNGAMTLCQTPYNPANGNIYPECYSLSQHVLDELVNATGCSKQYIWETDTMCGINWAMVPVTIVEVGYMSNPQEDTLMATEEYRDKICIGIANGIDKFFEEQSL